MRIERDRSGFGPIVSALGPGGFRIGERQFRAALLTATAAIEWMPPALALLDEAALGAVLEPLPEFLLLGTGATLVRPPAGLATALETRGIGIEAMDSRAAARAWGMLRGEGRTIAAALYPLDA